ncbi:MAG: helix-turn-helix transcriptional regulator [Carboxylicivirga sp.]|jgi:DNA-binding CsgD family transcriptional regulator|nr:helix-turn-helix transcriptional regulator [Carboxylicivirga sp.]
MLVYESDVISFSHLVSHQILLSKWKEIPIEEGDFKHALLKGAEIGTKLEVKRSIFDQKDFQFIIPHKLFSWINEEINIPSYRKGVDEVAFVISRDVKSQFSVMECFDTDFVYSPKFFTYQDEAIEWFNKPRLGPKRNQDIDTSNISWNASDGEQTAEVRLNVPISDLPVHLSFLKKHIEDYTFRQKHSVKFYSLTKREISILKQLAKGLQNKEIANNLYVSEQTVKTHRRNINRKLNTHHLIDLYEYATAFGLA